MDSTGDTIESIKILMLPWLAHGHVSPYLDLAKKLSLHNIKVYFCSSPVNLKPIRESSIVEDYPLIELVDLHLPSTLLPPHLHTTKNLPLHLNSTLKSTFDEAKPGYCHLLKALKPNLVIADLYQPWAAESANDLNLKSVVFFASSSASTAFLLHFTIRPGSVFPLSHPENDLESVGYFLGDEANGMTNRDRILKTLDKSNLILLRTSREIEPNLEYLSAITNKEVVPVGTLTQDRAWKDKLGGKNDSYIEEWLNQRNPHSVVYVSFGSEYFLTKQEMAEVARGLELSKVNFIWVIRFPGRDDHSKDMTIHEWLPEGFLERVEKTGLMLKGWAPQAKILGHPSTGGFVSHCGWSSTLEGIASGVPFIAMPMQFDQPMNAMFIEKIGVGLEVPKRDGKIDGEEMAKVIDEVVVSERGKQVRERVMKYSSKLKGNEELEMAAKKLVQIATV